MFDDPKKELNRLDAELRAEVYEDQLEALQNQELPDLDELLGEDGDSDWISGLFQEDTDTPTPSGHPRSTRNDAVDFHRTVYGDETIREDQAVFVEKKPRRKSNPPVREEPKEEKQKKESVGCLPFIIFLELLGIGGMLWWWFRWMR